MAGAEKEGKNPLCSLPSIHLEGEPWHGDAENSHPHSVCARHNVYGGEDLIALVLKVLEASDFVDMHHHPGKTAEFWLFGYSRL